MKARSEDGHCEQDGFHRSRKPRGVLIGATASWTAAVLRRFWSRCAIQESARGLAPWNDCPYSTGLAQSKTWRKFQAPLHERPPFSSFTAWAARIAASR